MADSLDTAVDTPGSAASTRPGFPEEYANWSSSAASQSINIANSLYREAEGSVTPFSNEGLGRLPPSPTRLC